MSDYNIKWIGAAPTNYERGRAGHQIRAIVQHLMTGTLRSTDDWFNRRRDQPSSAHFGVGENGEIHGYVPVEDTAYSNGILIKPNFAAVPWLREAPWPKPITANSFTISIEWEGNHVWQNGIIGGTVMEWWQPTEAQYQAGLWLNRKLVREQGIQPVRAYINRHSDFNSSMGPGGKGWCPGKLFPMQRLLDDLAKPVPALLPVTLNVEAAAALAKPISIKGPASISPAVFTAVMASHNSPALPLAAQLYDACVRRYADPAVALAFFGHESSFGAAGVVEDFQTHSWGNIIGDHSLGAYAIGKTPLVYGHNFRVYRSFVDGLEDWLDLMLGDYYQGLPDLAAQIGEYAPAGDGANSPTAYFDTVTAWVRAWQRQSGDFQYQGYWAV